jgi:hypothetical protein
VTQEEEVTTLRGESVVAGKGLLQKYAWPHLILVFVFIRPCCSRQRHRPSIPIPLICTAVLVFCTSSKALLRVEAPAARCCSLGFERAEKLGRTRHKLV